MKQGKRLVKVDAYFVPFDEEEQYRKDREELALRAEMIFKEFCAIVKRDWAGSEDGEAITGLNENGELIALIHLDPYGVEMLNSSENLQIFRQKLLEYNSLIEKTD